MSKQDWKQSQYYQEDFLASHSVQPGSDEARRMTVTSGLKCLELYKKSDPVGLLVRMLLESSRWRSTKCYLTWKASATPAKRSLFRLVPSMPRIEETAVPFWPTTTARDCKGANSMEHLAREGSRNHTDQLANAVRLWPTPRANDGEKRGNVSADPRNGLPGAVRLWPTPRVGGSKGRSPAGVKHGDLAAVVAMLQTPTTRDYKSPDMNPDSKRFSQKTELNSAIGGKLNPTWVEWLMGFPIGWTDLSASETP